MMTWVQLDKLYKYVSFEAPSVSSATPGYRQVAEPDVPSRSSADAQSRSRLIEATNVVSYLSVAAQSDQSRVCCQVWSRSAAEVEAAMRLSNKVQGSSHGSRYIREVTQAHGLSLHVRTDGIIGRIGWRGQRGREKKEGGGHSLHCISAAYG
ncbi:hypothetical protein LY76DRAFT_593687, partial [Colletotrichum caudatum]